MDYRQTHVLSRNYFLFIQAEEPLVVNWLSFKNKIDRRTPLAAELQPGLLFTSNIQPKSYKSLLSLLYLTDASLDNSNSRFHGIN